MEGSKELWGQGDTDYFPDKRHNCQERGSEAAQSTKQKANGR